MFYLIKDKVTDDLVRERLYVHSSLKLPPGDIVTFINTGNKSNELTVTMSASGGQLSQM